MRSIGLEYRCKTDRSAVQLSCPKLLLGKHLLGTLPFPEGTVLMLWKDQPVGGMWTGPSICGLLGLVSKYFILLQVLQKLCPAFVSYVLSRFFSDISTSLRFT